MEDVLPFLDVSITDYERCTDKLLKLLKKYMDETGKEGEKHLFSPSQRDPSCDLPMAGYYLGFLITHHIMLSRGIEYLIALDTADDMREAVDALLMMGR